MLSRLNKQGSPWGRAPLPMSLWRHRWRHSAKNVSTSVSLQSSVENLRLLHHQPGALWELYLWWFVFLFQSVVKRYLNKNWSSAASVAPLWLAGQQHSFKNTHHIFLRCLFVCFFHFRIFCRSTTNWCDCRELRRHPRNETKHKSPRASSLDS